MRRLGAEYKKKLRNEKIKIIFLRAWFKIYDKVSWMKFGPVFLAVSVFIIFTVALVLWLKISVNIDFPLLKFANPTQLGYMGQIGDFFGGVLNPLLSFMALIAVLFTIKMQSMELKEAKEETRIANRIQDKQTSVFERQNFESVLFRLLDVHTRIAERVRSYKSEGAVDRFEVISCEIVDSFYSSIDARSEYIYDGVVKGDSQPRMRMRQQSKDKSNENYLLSAIADVLTGEHKILVSQYFRNLYQILKLIDNFKLEIKDEFSDKLKRSKRQLRLEYFQRRQYCNILRAQLSDDEVKVLFFNCLVAPGAGLKYYVEKYSLLKHLDPNDFIGSDWNWGALYSDTAYADYEKITDYQIKNFYLALPTSTFGTMFPHS
uniref:putative phage abortive infection protein n=1 Tax=Pseudomonas lundensis TaxID=86185 RepID=UPI0028D30CCF|nr:putative phage abortive infection protein [Pseudomonas lundensis]